MPEVQTTREQLLSSQSDQLGFMKGQMGQAQQKLAGDQTAELKALEKRHMFEREVFDAEVTQAAEVAELAGDDADMSDLEARMDAGPVVVNLTSDEMPLRGANFVIPVHSQMGKAIKHLHESLDMPLNVLVAMEKL